jgi:hypothetical protein
MFLVTFVSFKNRLNKQSPKRRNFAQSGHPGRYPTSEHSPYLVTLLFGMQGCQIFLGTTYQNEKNIPNNRKISKCLKIYQVAVK